jgi:hypothetical protein
MGSGGCAQSKLWKRRRQERLILFENDQPFKIARLPDCKNKNLV